MSSITENLGCLPVHRVYSTGTAVQVMPRKLAGISAARNGQPLADKYTELDEQKLQLRGYKALVHQAPDANNPEGLYRLKVLGTTQLTGWLPASVIFGPAYDIGDVVEVGDAQYPGTPPARRIFIGYAFDAAFKAVVQTYDSDDTTAILEDCNTAVVELEESEAWNTVFPEAELLKEEPPQYEVNLAVNGRSCGIRELSRLEWCEIYDNA